MGSEVEQDPEVALPFHFPTLLIRVRKRWKSLIFFALLSLLGGIAVALVFGVRVYGAEAVLHYRPSQAEKDPPNLLTLLNMVKLQENLEEVRRRTRRGVSLLALSRALKVDVRRDTELLVIKGQGDTPESAAELVRAARDVFLERQQSKRRKKLQFKLKSLEERLLAVTQELKKADENLQSFTVKHRIVDLDKEAQWYLEELTSLQIMLEEAQVQRTSVRQKSENIDRIVGDLKRKVAQEKAESTTEFDSLGDINIRVQRLRAAIHDDKEQRAGEALLLQKKLELDRAVQLREAGLLSDSEYEKRKASFERQQALTVDTEQVAEWKEQVDDLNAKAIPNRNQQAQSGPILQEMMLKAFEIELERVTQDKRVASVQEAVKRARTRLDALPELQRRYAALAREVEAAEAQKKDLEERVGTTRRLLSSRLLDFVSASEPRVDKRPLSSNRRLLALAISLASMVFLGVSVLLLECLGPTCRSLPELRLRSGLPILGSLPADGGKGASSLARDMLARSLPRRGVYAIASVNPDPGFLSTLTEIGRALHRQGVSTALVGEGLELEVSAKEGPGEYRGQAFQELLSQLRENSELILVSTDPACSSVALDILAEECDGALLVVDVGTPVSLLQEIASRVGERLRGVVLSGVTKEFAHL